MLCNKGHECKLYTLLPATAATLALRTARMADPEGHLAYFISDTVDSLNREARSMSATAKDGSRNQPFHPAMMVKVLVYAYASGVFSSRKIAKKLHEDVAFRVLAANNFPAHRTIREFRAQHLAEFTELFTQVVRLARRWGWSNWAPSRSMAPRSRPMPAATRR
jgi:transposase